MNTQTFDDIAIVIKGTDTAASTKKRIDIQKAGVSQFSVDEDGLIAGASVNYVTKTVKKTIGGIGITADFNFVTAGDKTEQVIDLGAIIPARARVIDTFTVTEAVFTGATTLVAETGISSSGAELIASATIYAADAVTSMAHATSLLNVPNVAALHVYVAATPGANWSNVTAGKVSVYITYIDVTGI